MCELSANAKESIQTEDTWTLKQLKEYFFDKKIVANHHVDVNITIDQTIDLAIDHQNQQLPSESPVGMEFKLVSILVLC